MGDMADQQIDDMIDCMIQGGYCPDCDMTHDPEGPCACSGEEDHMYLAELYKKDSKGGTRHWRIWLDSHIIKTEHGLLGGEMVLSEKGIYKGKNVGKANETTPEEQALSEALSTIQKKRDKGYDEDPDKEPPLLPMLAHKYKDRKKDIIYPCYIQPKLDGVRCLAQLDSLGEVHLTSRTCKEFAQPFQKMKEQIAFQMNFGDIWDGELYTDQLSFEDLVGACRREEYMPDSDLVEFHVFDIMNDKSFKERFVDFISSHGIVADTYIKPVTTYPCRNEEGAMQWYAQWMTEGYEGIMFRNAAGAYQLGHRSKDLQKYKEFIDDEFTIVGAKEGAGSDEGTVIWIVQVRDGITCDVRPRGSHAQRSIWWEERKGLIGKQFTVRYQGLTDKGSLRFPVGLCVRDYE